MARVRKNHFNAQKLSFIFYVHRQAAKRPRVKIFFVSAITL
jgi:hypothetical protein